jgi:hypothetical protein
VLHGFDDPMSAECLQTAIRVWDEEHKHPPSLFRSFNTTGGELTDEETKAAVELLVATNGDAIYRKRLQELLPVIEGRMGELGWIAVRAILYMDGTFKSSMASAAGSYLKKLDPALSKNPYGVPIATGTWGGSGAASGLAVQMYYLHQAFPDIVGTGYTLRGINYVLVRYPSSV